FRLRLRSACARNVCVFFIGGVGHRLSPAVLKTADCRGLTGSTPVPSGPTLQRIPVSCHGCADFTCMMCQMHNRALAQVCAVCSPLRAQNSCHGLMVAALSDSVACKVKSWLLQLDAFCRPLVSVFPIHPRGNC